MESQITDEILQVGAETFLYFSNCPEQNTFKWSTFYTELFSNYSKQVVVKNLRNYELKLGEQFYEKESPISKQLFEKLEQRWNFSSGIIGTFLSTKSELSQSLAGPQFERILTDLNTCLFNNSCQAIETRMTPMGF